MFDLKSLDTKSGANEGFELEIVHPATLEGTGLFITVLGEDSDTYRKHSNEQQRRRLKKTVQRGVGAVDISVEDLDADALTLLSACTKSWRMKDSDKVLYEGKEFPCNAANAQRLYEDLPAVRAQVDQAIRNRANFTARSAKG